MATQVSPGVLIQEIDKSDSLTQVATTAGAIAGPFTWGPIEQVVTVSNETQLVSAFGKPNTDTAVSFFTSANFLSYANTLRVVRAANTAAKNATENAQGLLIKNQDHYELSINGVTEDGVVAAKYAGPLGNSLRIEICANTEAFSESPAIGTLNVASHTGVNVVFSGAITSLGFQNGDILIINGQKRSITNNAVNSTTVAVNTAFTGTITSLAFKWEWKYARYFTVAPGTSDWASARGAANDEMHIIVIDEDGDITGVPGSIIERYEGLSKAGDARASNGEDLYYKNVLNNQSAWVWWTDHPAGGTNWGNTAAEIGGSDVEYASPATTLQYSLDGGTAGETAPDLSTAYDKFANESVDISFILGADASAVNANYIIANVLGVRPYVMAFFSPEKADVVNNVGSEVDDVLAFRDSLTSTSYAVLDSGWKYQYDKYNRVYRWIPLNGDVAGCAARTDRVSEAWFSPAGFTRGQVKIGNTIKLAWNPNQTQRDELYIKGVNPVVAFPGEGTVLYGDKTLQAKPSAFDRINVRRLFIVLEKTIERSAKYQLFEQNDEFTRNSFINMVEPFLRSVKGRRGISDFYVVCDETNNPQDAVDRNEFRADIYIKPIRSINFIQLNFVAVRSDVSFTEVISNLG